MARFITGVIAASLLLVCSALVAQEETPRFKNTEQNRNTQNREKPQNTAQNNDSLKTYRLGKLLLMNECAIQVSKVAQQKASAPEVKEFARMLEQDHTKWSQKIRAAAPEFEQLIEAKRFQNHTTSLQNPAEEQPSSEKAEPAPLAKKENPAEENPAQQSPEEQTTKKATFPENAEWKGQPVHEILKYECEVSQAALKSSLELLSEQQGQDFDMAFLGMAIAGHTHALAELNAIRDVQDPQFQQMLQEARTGTEKHLKQAKELAAKYEDREDQDTGKTPNRNKTSRENPTQTDPENRTPTQPQRNPTLPRSQPQPE